LRPSYFKALTSLTDPAKVATLGDRAANPRLKKVVFSLSEAKFRGVDVSALIEQVQTATHTECHFCRD
jgi:hypothetical protein